MEREQSNLTLKAQADLLGLSRASLYYQPEPPSAEELAIKHRLDELYTEFPYYGSRKMTILLRPAWTINRKRVRRYLREMGLMAIYPGPNTSQPAPGHKIYPYLLRGLKASFPNHIWGIDITYIKLQHGWMYLVAILDWYSRFVISYALAQTLEMPFVLDAVTQALAQATPQIINSDQGSHFTSPQYLDLFKPELTRISMDGRGRAMDNIFTERLWRSLKYEEVYLHDYETPRQARQGLSTYLHHYNYARPHQALGYLTPSDLYLNSVNFLTNETVFNEKTTNETNKN